MLGHAIAPQPPSAQELARNLRSASRFPARDLIVRHWALLTTIALLIAATLGTVRVLLDHTNPITPIIGPVGAVFGGMFVYAAMILFVDRVVAPIPTTLDDVAASQVSVRRREIARGVAEHVALVIAIASAVVGVLAVWGIDVFDPRGPIGRSAGLFIAILLATTAYRAVKLWLDQEIALERWAATEEEGQGATAAAIGSTTRLGTLLGIVRGFLLASIFIVAIMIALDELGVNIGPLFAGAGLIGIAVSFGSQSLIKDMFSGMFYLIDDAFRTGEYIDIGLVKGTVEKISIRSFQLRHQNGPLNTVPFGEIKKLTNYSRDWVIVKLPIRVTYDTSVSHLNKVVKRISAELLEDEDVGPLFLQPLKSQGVYDMEDSAMVIRVKFMTRPNDQFLVRRAVYAKIRETFHAEGIKFAHRNVTVFVGSLDGQPVTPAQKAAAGAAIAPVVEDEAILQTAEEEDEGLPQP
ncbi:mechanosensitive ion channel family protein [Rhizobiales bacterium Sp-1]|uniref:Mechanosensitive ion channel family protein n=2 Tax=Segnochrobactrum spirostomi TaxID=2608987 RepID=A0A6A7Y939_9HYPH|nr:mechanosensitive ion channel family protein [Segnochrobactrum spirostomi]